MKIYLVTIFYGEYEDYTEKNIFVTKDKNKAENWVSRFNIIIESNKEGLKKYYDDNDFEKKEPFWHSFICYENPYSKVREIELR